MPHNYHPMNPAGALLWQHHDAGATSTSCRLPHSCYSDHCLAFAAAAAAASSALSTTWPMGYLAGSDLWVWGVGIVEV